MAFGSIGAAVASTLIASSVVWAGAVSARSAGAAVPDDPTLGPLVCGTAHYVDGHYVWTDYAYDDQGPDVDGRPGGDAEYPEGLANTADLIQLQLGRTPDDELEVTAVLETLVDDGVPVLGVGLDLDGDANTGAAAFPGNGTATAAPLGLEVVARLAKRGSSLWRFEESRWIRTVRLDVAIDSDANTVAGVLAGLPLPKAGTWRAYAGLGIVSRDGTWLDGAGAPFDLAFVGGEPINWAVRFGSERSAWQDQRQADVLSGRLDPTRAGADVDLARLRAGSSHPAESASGRPEGRAAGAHTLLYRSRLDLGEGIHPFPADSRLGSHDVARLHKLYAGPYQPYVLWLPQRFTWPAPLIVFLHGTGSNHLSATARSWMGPGRIDPPAVVVHPLGRGQATGYFGAAEQDILDVMADTVSRYDIDEERIVLTGWSAGGMGTLRLGQLRPDLFTALVPLVGHSRQVQWIEHVISGGEFFLPHSLENLYNLPVRSISGRLDDSKADDGPDRDELDLYALGYDYRHWLLFRRAHEVVPELVDSALVDAIATPRVRDPARVVYSVEPYLWKSEPNIGLEQRYDRAYWVSHVRVRGERFERGDKGSVDVTSLARADRARVVERISEYGVSRRADLVGPNPTVSTGDRWVVRGLRLEPGAPAPVSNSVVAKLERIASVTLDLARMGLQADEPLGLEIEGDGESELRLYGPFTAGVRLEGDAGGERDLEPVDGVISVRADFTDGLRLGLRPLP